MDASDVLNVSAECIVDREVYLHQFVDQLRRSDATRRRQDIVAPHIPHNAWTPVVAAAIESVCLEMHEPTPEWTNVVSDSPVFIPAVRPDSAAARVLRRVSPAPFSKRNVYVPANFMARC
jgi:hypothetical protein